MKNNENYEQSTKPELRQWQLKKLKTDVEKEAWIALRQYFYGAGNGSEAKISVGILSNIAREKQADNNARQLDIIEKRLLLKAPESITE